MNRKLHNTVTALFATSGLLALSLVASRPLTPDAPSQALPGAAQVAHVDAVARQAEARAARLEPRLAELAALSARAATLAAMADAIDQAEVAEVADATTAPAAPVRRSHRGRQSVAMPFFSFFPKG